jgi:zinc/manganese transport system substrate-binding protein
MTKFASSLFLTLIVSIQAQGAPVRVVASFSILQNILQNILPSSFEIESLVPKGLDTHGYQGIPQDFIKIKKADLVILVGQNFEPWAAPMLQKTKSKASVYYLTEGLNLLPTGHGKDPHIWQSPKMMIQALQILAPKLEDKYPSKKNEISKRTEKYIKQLRIIQENMEKEFKALPKNSRRMVVAHNSFQYFAEEFDVEVYSPLNASHEGETSIQNFSKIIKLIKNEKIKPLFLENSASEGLMKSLSKETGYPLVGTLYSDVLSTDNKAATYLQLLEYNFNLILNSMKGLSL